MTALSQATASLSDVLGWTLIHFIWQGTAVAALLGLSLLLIPRGLARARYLAGCLSLGLMLIVPALTAWQLAGSSGADIHDAGLAAAPLDGAALEGRVLPLPRQTAGNEASPVGGTSRDSGSVRPALDLAPLLPWVVMAWATGVLLCSLRLAGGWWQARRLVRIGTHPAPERWQHAKAVLAARLRLARPVRLLESSRVHVPVVIGWLRPVLLLPPAVLTGLTPRQLEAVLAHELAHVRRHDYIVNLLQAAVETLLFYHPAVWWVSRTVRVEREHCCDDVAVAACGDAVLYARALTAVESLRHAHTAGMALAVTGSPLMARVRRLLGVSQPMRVSSSGWVVAALTGLMVSGAGATSWFRDFPIVVSPTDSATAEAASLPAVVQEPPSDKAPRPSPSKPAPAPSADEKRDPAAKAGTDSGDQEQRERERAMAEARKAMREAKVAVRAALREHRDALRAARHEAIRDVEASVRRVLQENREALRAARLAIREARPELEAEMQQLMRDAAKLSREAAEQARPEIEVEMQRLRREIAEISSEAAREAAVMAAEIAREVAREIERSLERDVRELRDPDAKPDPAPVPPAPPAPPAEGAEPPTPAEPPAPPVPPQSKSNGVPVVPAAPRTSPAPVVAPFRPAPPVPPRP